MVSPAFPGLFFAFAAMALLLFASIGPPAWQTVNFLKVNAGNAETTFGVFGICVTGTGCTSRSVGYDLMASGINTATQSALNQGILHNLTYILVLHPVAGLVMFFSLLLGLLGVVAASRVATILMAMFAAFGALLTLVVFIIDMVLWNISRNIIQSGGYSATLGNQNWFTVGALVAAFLCMCTSFCGACGRFATGRMAGEKVF